MAINSLKSLPPIGRAFFSKWLEKINEIINGINGVDEEIGTDETEGSILGRITALESSSGGCAVNVFDANITLPGVSGNEYNTIMESARTKATFIRWNNSTNGATYITPVPYIPNDNENTIIYETKWQDYDSGTEKATRVLFDGYDKKIYYLIA